MPKIIQCGDCNKEILKIAATQFCKECAKKREKQYRKEYRQRNYVKRRQALYIKKYRKENPEKCNKILKNRRDRIRERAFKILGRKCLRCGYFEFECSLDVHHKKKSKNLDWQCSKFQDWNNLIFLCRNCHHALHQGKWKI